MENGSGSGAPSASHLQLVQEAIDSAVDKLLDEISTQVVFERDEHVVVATGNGNEVLSDCQISFPVNECVPADCAIELQLNKSDEKLLIQGDFGTATGALSFPREHAPNIGCSAISVNGMDVNKVSDMQIVQKSIDSYVDHHLDAVFAVESSLSDLADNCSETEMNLHRSNRFHSDKSKEYAVKSVEEEVLATDVLISIPCDNASGQFDDSEAGGIGQLKGGIGQFVEDGENMDNVSIHDINIPSALRCSDQIGVNDVGEKPACSVLAQYAGEVGLAVTLEAEVPVLLPFTLNDHDAVFSVELQEKGNLSISLEDEDKNQNMADAGNGNKECANFSKFHEDEGSNLDMEDVSSMSAPCFSELPHVLKKSDSSVQMCLHVSSARVVECEVSNNLDGSPAFPGKGGSDVISDFHAHSLQPTGDVQHVGWDNNKVVSSNMCQKVQQLPRRMLQTLCKRNGIRANISNEAMVDALHLLDSIKGWEEMVLFPSAGPCMMQGRSSSRIAALGDANMLEKAMKLVDKKNSLVPGYLQGNILDAVLGVIAA